MQETKTHDTGRNLIGAKVYFDGSQWIAIPHTERPYRKRGNKIRAKPNESEAVAEFEQAFKKAKDKRQKRKESLIKEFAPLFKSEEQASDEYGNKYILSPKFTCITDGEILGTVSPEIIAQMPKCN